MLTFRSEWFVSGFHVHSGPPGHFFLYALITGECQFLCGDPHVSPHGLEFSVGDLTLMWAAWMEEQMFYADIQQYPCL